MTAGTERETDVRARGFEKAIDGIGDGAAVAVAMQIGQQLERVADRLVIRAVPPPMRAADGAAIQFEPVTAAAGCREPRTASRFRVANTESSSSGHSMAEQAARSVSTSSRW